jgi:uncharacterized membrane protein
MRLYASMLFLHLVAVVVWVGGMFLMHFAVRPACAELLDPPKRLAVLADILRRFFRWVAASVLVVLATGVAGILVAGGFGVAHPSVHMMFGVGLVMVVIFAHIRLMLFPRLQAAVVAADWPAAAGMLAMVRKEVAINLVLGIATIAIATLGRGITV